MHLIKTIILRLEVVEVRRKLLLALSLLFGVVAISFAAGLLVGVEPYSKIAMYIVFVFGSGVSAHIFDRFS